MNHIKFVVAGALALLGVLVIGGDFADPAPKATDEKSASAGGTLRIGVDGTEPAFYKVDGVTKGFDYEMALGVAEGLGAKPEFVVMDFSDLFTALEAGEIDMYGAQVTETAERSRTSTSPRPTSSRTCPSSPRRTRPSRSARTSTARTSRSSRAPSTSATSTSSTRTSSASRPRTRTPRSRSIETGRGLGRVLLRRALYRARSSAGRRSR